MGLLRLIAAYGSPAHAPSGTTQHPVTARMCVCACGACFSVCVGLGPSLRPFRARPVIASPCRGRGESLRLFVAAYCGTGGLLQLLRSGPSRGRPGSMQPRDQRLLLRLAAACKYCGLLQLIILQLIAAYKYCVLLRLVILQLIAAYKYCSLSRLFNFAREKREGRGGEGTEGESEGAGERASERASERERKGAREEGACAVLRLPDAPGPAPAPPPPPHRRRHTGREKEGLVSYAQTPPLSPFFAAAPPPCRSCRQSWARSRAKVSGLEGRQRSR